MGIVEVQEMIRKMQITHWVVMLANMMFCLSVAILTTRLIGRVRRERDSTCDQIRREDRTEICRLRKIIRADEDMMRDHKAQITDRDETIDSQANEINTLVSAVVERDSKLNGLTGTIEQHQGAIRFLGKQIDRKTDAIRSYLLQQGHSTTQISTLQDAVKESDTAYENLRMEYDQLHAADKLLERDLGQKTRDLNAMTLERDRLLEVIKLRDEKIDKLVSRTNELNAQIDGLKYKFETRGGQVPDLNTAWHMKETPVAVKQKYILDDTPLDENGSGVIDSQPYGE